MKLINNTKNSFKISKGIFTIGSIVDLGDDEARTLLKYSGIKKCSDLEIKTIKEKDAELDAELDAEIEAEEKAKKEAELEARKEAKKKAKKED